jgi:hypothetical protein
MKRINLVLMAISMCFFFTEAAHSFDFVLSDGEGITYEATFDGRYLNNSYYILTVEGGKAYGILFFDEKWGSFKICVFENAVFWGYTIEGHWTGDGSTGYGSNNVGELYETQIFVGPASPAGRLSSDAKHSNLK